jgi:hypothetical protein
MKMNWSIEDHKHYIGECSNTLIKILNEYLSKPDTSNATKEINDCMSNARKQIEIEMKIVMDYLVELLK